MVLPGTGVSLSPAGPQGPKRDLEPLSRALVRLLRYPTPDEGIARHAQGWCRLQEVVALPWLRGWSQAEMWSVIMENTNLDGQRRFQVAEYDREIWVRARAARNEGRSTYSNEGGVADASFQHGFPPPRQRPTPPRLRQGWPSEPKTPTVPPPQEDNRNALGGVDATTPSGTSMAEPSAAGLAGGAVHADARARSPPQGMAEPSAACLAPNEEQEVENLASADAPAAQDTEPGARCGSQSDPQGTRSLSPGEANTAQAPPTPSPPPEFILHRSVSSRYRDWVLMTQWPSASAGVWMAAEDSNAFFYVNEPGVWARYRDSGNGNKVYWFNHDTEEWFFAEG